MKTYYEVEWCTHIPPMPEMPDEGDHDNAVFEVEDFRTEAEALAKAKEVLPLDQYGSVRISPFHVERYEPGYPATYREYHDRDIQYYSGDDE